MHRPTCSQCGAVLAFWPAHLETPTTIRCSVCAEPCCVQECDEIATHQLTFSDGPDGDSYVCADHLHEFDGVITTTELYPVV